MVVARKDSPLVIGTGNDENYVASDIPAILSYTKNFYLLDDGEIVEIYKDKINFYNIDLEKVDKQIKNIDWDATSSDKRWLC